MKGGLRNSYYRRRLSVHPDYWLATVCLRYTPSVIASQFECLWDARDPNPVLRSVLPN